MSIAPDSYRIASLPRPKAALGMDGRLQEADGWQPKSFTTASGRGNQPAGDDPESQPRLPGSFDQEFVVRPIVAF